MSDRVDTVVVGAGQAGLATSHELSRNGVPHVVLERGRVGETWRGRWESFCLVTPNWSMRLPGHPYDGEDPDGFEPRDEIVAFLERCARSDRAPLHQGVEVTAVDPAPGDGFRLATSTGEIEARRVVLSAGAYRRPHRPPPAAALPGDLLQVDVEDYVDPAGLPAGSVLIVGGGQSGCQIAEELQEAGREVFLACGRAPWAPRRIGDRDLFWWLEESGFPRGQRRLAARPRGAAVRQHPHQRPRRRPRHAPAGPARTWDQAARAPVRGGGAAGPLRARPAALARRRAARGGRPGWLRGRPLRQRLPA